MSSLPRELLPIDVSSEIMPDDSHNEHSPLLAPSPSPSSCNSAASTTERRRDKWSPKAISYLFLMVIVAVVTAESISLPALTRMYESIYCRQYYAKRDPSLIGRDGVPERFCKVSSVQGDVAMLKAWQTFFDAAGSLSLAVPWGYYADTRGRKPVLLLVSVSLLARSMWIQVVCYFWKALPVRAIWLAGLHSVSGGAPVFSALAYVVVADVVPQEERVAMFFRYGASQLFATFISSPLSAFFMQFGLFVPTVLGTCLMALMVWLVSFLPETLNYSAGVAGSHSPTPSSVKERIRQLPSRVRASTSFLWSDVRVAILVPIYSMHMLIYNTNDLLVQYTSARFHIPIHRAVLITSLQSALVIVHLLFILPAVTRFLTARLGVSSQSKDLLLARCSALFMALGFFGVGLAPTLPLLIAAIPVEVAGWGFMFVTRSLVTSFVEPHHVARLYMVLTLADVAGLMVGSPTLAGLFDRGLQSGGAAVGLPFVVCGSMVAAVGTLLLTFRVTDAMAGPRGEDETLL